MLLKRNVAHAELYKAALGWQASSRKDTIKLARQHSDITHDRYMQLGSLATELSDKTYTSIVLSRAPSWKVKDQL